MTGRLLILSEREAGCAERLRGTGFGPDVATEIAGYLSQATDLVAFEAAIATALASVGVSVRFADPTAPEEWFDWLCERPSQTLVWPVTDGIWYYRGSAGAAIARLVGARRFGSPAAVQHLSQDKAKAGAVAAALGVPVPATGLLRDGAWLSPSPGGSGPWFVKPNTLGAKLGIWADSRVDDLEAALALSRRIFARYRDDAVVQAYVPGFDVRVSWMAVDRDPGLDRIGVYRLDSGGGGETAGDFMAMADNRTLSGTSDTEGTASASRTGRAAFVPRMVDVALGEPALAAEIAGLVRRAANGIGLRDVFSMDFRVAWNGKPCLLEFEGCPAVTIYDFGRYLADNWGCDLPEALARAIPPAFSRADEP